MKPQHSIDYVLLDSDDKAKTAVGIQTGRFAGVLYHYGNARIEEEENFARMVFSYTIISTPKMPVEELMQDHEFQTFIGDILTDILMSQVEANEKARDYDSEEFDI
jgi:hypothetical protein